jgi:hypothetical protein
MRKSRRVVVPLAVFALMAAGGITAGLSLVAHANEFAICDSRTTVPISCGFPNTNTTDTTINTPSAIQAVVTLTASDNAATPDQYVQIVYQVFCSQGGNESTTQNTTNDNFAITKGTAVTDSLTLGYTDPDSCEVINLTATLEVGTTTNSVTTYSTNTTGSFNMQLEWTPASTPSSTTTTSTSSPVNVSYISGYDNKCIDDKGNSSSDRTSSGHATTPIRPRDGRSPTAS